MKTKYSRRTNILSAQAQLMLGVVGVMIVIGVILRLFFPDALTLLFSPLWKMGNAVTTSFVSFENIGVLKAERDTLQSDNETLLHENEMLRARLADVGAVDAHKEEGILAGVVSRPPVAPYDVLIVERGMDDGVVLGARVFAKSVPIGTVEEVGARTARVVLFSTPEKITEGWVGEQRLPLSLKGEGSGAFIAEMPRVVSVVAGDTVYLPGPGAYPAGTVYKVESNPSSPRVKLIITPLVNPFELTWVYIAF